MNDYISYSQINMFLRCPAQYMFRYCEGLIIPPKSALTKGKSVHKGQEVNYKQKIETKADLPVSDVLDVVATEFETLATETEFAPDEDKGKIKDETIGLAKLYHKEIAPKVQPLYVEEEINFIIPNTEIQLKGYIDVVQEGGIIRDTKTAAKTPAQNVIDKSMQLTAYALAYRTITGETENKLILDYLINTKTPKVLSLESSRTEDDLKRFVAIVQNVVKAIKAGIFYPNPDNFMCTPNNCGYWHECQKKFKTEVFK